MVSNKRRRRELARAKWQRQQERRDANAQRTRRIQLVVGTIVGLVAAAALVWVVVWVVQQEDERTPSEVTPTGDSPSFISEPPETETPTQPTPTTPRSSGTGEPPTTTAPSRTAGTATISE